MSDDLPRFNPMDQLLDQDPSIVLMWIQDQPPPIHEAMWRLADFLQKSLERYRPSEVIQFIGLIAGDEEPPRAGASWRIEANE